MNDEEIYKRTAGKNHWDDFKRGEQKEQLQPISLVNMLIALIGFAAGFAAVMYIAYLILMAV